jgi:hypothetical protein
MLYILARDLLRLNDIGYEINIIQTKKNNPMKNLTKTTFAVLAIGFISCTLFPQQAQATMVTGDITFSGIVTYDSTSLGSATRVLTWNSSSVLSNSGDFAGFTFVGQAVTMAATYIFSSSTPTPGLWSVGGFTFDLISTTIVSQSNSFLNLTGTGFVSGNGFDPTPFLWSFTSTSAGGNHITFGFLSDATTAVPDGGMTVTLLGVAFCALGIARRFMMS